MKNTAVKTKEKLIIVGTGTTAKQAYDFVKMYGLYDVLGFAVNSAYRTADEFRGHPVFTIEGLRDEVPGDDYYLYVAVLWNRLNRDRRELYEELKQQGYRFANLISPTAIIRGKITGDNCWIHDLVIIQSDAHLHSDISIMAYTLIGADTTIHSHCFFGAKSTLGGNSTVGEQSFIGINATVFDDTAIGEKCIVGACTAVKRNLPDYSVCKTSPAATEIRQYTEQEIESKLLFAQNRR